MTRTKFWSNTYTTHIQKPRHYIMYTSFVDYKYFFKLCIECYKYLMTCTHQILA